MLVRNSLKTAALSFGIAVLFAGVALAHGSGGPGTKSVKLVIKGTGSTAPGGKTAPDGQCFNTGDPWVDDYTGTCSVPGNCSCTEVTATVSGNSLKGGTVTNFFVTDDKGIDPVTVTPVSPGPTNPSCHLNLGTFTATNSSSQSTTLNFVGVTCEILNGVSSHNPSGTETAETMSGGWGVSSTPAPTKTTSGWGTFTGTVNDNTHAASLKLSGWITQ
jgi:hypothetical protein